MASDILVDDLVRVVVRPYCMHHCISLATILQPMKASCSRNVVLGTKGRKAGAKLPVTSMLYCWTCGLLMCVFARVFCFYPFPGTKKFGPLCSGSGCYLIYMVA